MVNLPMLIKSPGKKYNIGVDVFKTGNIETFTFCIMESKTKTITQLGTVHNEARIRASEEYLRYIENFYGNSAMIYVDK